MKIIRYIILSVVVLAAMGILIWKGNVAFLSSNVLQDVPLTTHSQYFRLQLPPGV